MEKSEKKPSLINEEALKEFLEELGEKSYRVGQIQQALFRDLYESIEDFTTLPQGLRDSMKDHFVLSPLTVKKHLISEDGTEKALFETQDGSAVEAVLMRHASSRLTLCISSQVGCPVKCVFCSTGAMGYTRNLHYDEIVAQVLYFNQKLKKEGARVRNIVFMGMGEPLLNYDNAMRTIAMLNDQKKFEIGIRHITVSTSGIVPKLKEMMKEDILPNLAVSLHAPNDELRTRIMPINNAYPLKDLMEVLEDYSEKTKKRIFYEYVMLKNINDSILNAKELVHLIGHQNAHVNLIPFNPGGSLEDLECSDRNVILAFQKVLQDGGVPTTVRYTFGQDIDAACGQLAAKEQ